MTEPSLVNQKLLTQNGTFFQYRQFIFFILLLFSISSCSDNKAVKATLSLQDDIIHGLGSPITMGVSTTVVDLSDYLIAEAKIDSVTAEGVAQEIKGSSVHIYDWPTAQAMTSLDLWSNGEVYSIPFKRSDKRLVKFQFDPQGKRYDSVKMKGEMTAWNPDVVEFKRVDDVYVTDLVLEPRDYQYIMVLDGEEKLDFNNPTKIENGIGGFNSLLESDKIDKDQLQLSAFLENSTITFQTNDLDAELIVFWEDRLIEVLSKDGKYELTIPNSASNVQRSHIRAWAYDQDRISNDLLIPLETGKVITSADVLTRKDKHLMTLYNVFVDRFHNGDKSNDRPVDTGEVLPLANDMGGDIRGAIQKLEDGYFEEIGVNTIWISPIVKNVEGAWGEWPDPATKFSAYHGYWPVSFTLIDDRKGTPEELKELVTKAHDKGLNVLLDFVANHVHEEHTFYRNDTTLATDLYLPDGSLNTERWDDHRLTTWFDVFLPTLRLDDPRVYETLTDSAVYWIEEYDLDGFRHDATKHVPEIFWKTLTRKLKDGPISNGKELYQIGETYGSADLIASYVNSGQLDAQFDFNLYDAIVATLCREEVGFERLVQEIEKSLNTYGHHNLMGNITGNQDRGRFISYAGGALRFDENAKVAGWTREIGIGNDVAFSRSKQLMALISTLPGLPVIYYGDEIGSYGGNDPDNRKMMRFSGLSEKESSVKETTSELLHFRRSSLPLLYGDFRSHVVDKDLLVYSRTYLGQTVYVAINTSLDPMSISFNNEDYQSRPSSMFDENGRMSSEEGRINLEIDSNSYQILY